MSGMARRFDNVPDLQRHAVRVPCEPQVFDLLSTAADDPLGFGFTSHECGIRAAWRWELEGRFYGSRCGYATQDVQGAEGGAVRIRGVRAAEPPGSRCALRRAGDLRKTRRAGTVRSHEADRRSALWT